MNEHEIERIAAMAHALRPDWPANSLRTLIATRLADRPRRDVTVALAWVACESATTTPARVLEAGPWWRAAAADGETTPRPPKRGELCHHCTRWVDMCVCPEPQTRPFHRVPPTDDWAQARADIAAARTNHTPPEEET